MGLELGLLCQTTIFKIRNDLSCNSKSIIDQLRPEVLGWNNDTKQTQFTDEDHVIWLKAPEKASQWTLTWNCLDKLEHGQGFLPFGLKRDLNKQTNKYTTHPNQLVILRNNTLRAAVFLLLWMSEEVHWHILRSWPVKMTVFHKHARPLNISILFEETAGQKWIHIPPSNQPVPTYSLMFRLAEKI